MLCSFVQAVIVSTTLLCFTAEGAWRDMIWKHQGPSESAETAENLLASLDSLPANFYSGELMSDSECLLAYTEMTKLCDASSERKRLYLATLLTNCHLEAAGRKTIFWDPEHRLRDATHNEVELVMQYIPLLRRICDQTGNGYDLAIFRMQVDTDMRLLSNIEDLRQAVRDAKVVNEESERLQDKFLVFAEESISRSRDVQNLTTDLKGATNSLRDEYNQLLKIEASINSTIQAFMERNSEFATEMMNVLEEATSNVQTLSAQVEFRNKYDELHKNYTKLQEDVAQKGNLSESCLEHQFPVIGQAIAVGADFLAIQFTWLRVLRDTKDALWRWLILPIKLIVRLQAVKEHQWLNDRARVLVATAQLFVILGTFSLLYWILGLFNNIYKLCGPLPFILGRSSRILGSVLSSKSTCTSSRSVTMRSGQANIQQNETGSWTGAQAQNNELVRSGRNFAQVDRSSELEVWTELNLIRKVLQRIEDFEEEVSNKLLERVHRIERRQIHIHGLLQRERTSS